MAVLTGRMTKLEAVNVMLRSVGEVPANSLTSGLPQASSAEAFLDDANRRVQLRGWVVNTRYSFTLNKNSDDEFPLPNNTLVATPVDAAQGFAQTRSVAQTNSGHLRTAPRMNASATRWVMYDMINNSETWTTDAYDATDMTVDLIELLNFIDVTPYLQYLIMAIATRQFQKGDNQSIILHEFTAEDIRELESLAQSEDEELEHLNVLRDSPTMRDIVARRNWYWGR